jgi:DNA-binding CsgD family transcriptional regulator
MDSTTLERPLAFQKIQNIVENVLQSKCQVQVLAYLSSTLDFNDKPVSALISKLNEEGFIRTEMTIDWQFNIEKYEDISVTSDSPIALSLKKMKLIISPLDFETNKDKLPINLSRLEESKTIVVLPVSISKSYAFLFNANVNAIQRLHDYLECVRSILMHWERVNDSNSRKNLPSKKTLDEPLTLRQKEVLTLIREGKTNSSIGKLLGYSESLIRQESISIYRKLGVNGRRAIRERVAST